MSGANLQCVNLIGEDLRGADFRGADLTGTLVDLDDEPSFRDLWITWTRQWHGRIWQVNRNVAITDDR